jgi:hypothetical protein
VSHTTHGPEGTVFHHNGDYSGGVVIKINAPTGGGGRGIEVPFADVRALVFGYLRARKIEQLEQSGDAAFEAMLLGTSTEEAGR